MTDKEILPPMLYEAWLHSQRSFRLGCGSDLSFKHGMEFSFRLLLPYLKAALPCVEAMARDTRLRQADGELVLLLAQIKELVMNPTHDMPNMPIVKNDELERLRAFARDLYEYAEDLCDDLNSHAYGADIRKIINYREIPDGRIVGSLKAPG